MIKKLRETSALRVEKRKKRRKKNYTLLHYQITMKCNIKLRKTVKKTQDAQQQQQQINKKSNQNEILSIDLKRKKLNTSVSVCLCVKSIREIKWKKNTCDLITARCSWSLDHHDLKYFLSFQFVCSQWIFHFKCNGSAAFNIFDVKISGLLSFLFCFMSFSCSPFFFYLNEYIVYIMRTSSASNRNKNY